MPPPVTSTGCSPTEPRTAASGSRTGSGCWKSFATGSTSTTPRFSVPTACTSGGPAIVTRWAAKLNLTGTRPPADPGKWGDTRITAKDVVRIYQYVLAKAPGAILTALRGATERGSDGFRQYFGIPDAAGGRPWAVKQGWSCCNPARTLHT